MRSIVFKSLFEVGQVWEHLYHGHIGRLNDKIYEAKLRLRYVRRGAIVELTDREPVGLLEVSFCEELHED